MRVQVDTPRALTFPRQSYAAVYMRGQEVKTYAAHNNNTLRGYRFGLAAGSDSLLNVVIAFVVAVSLSVRGGHRGTLTCLLSTHTLSLSMGALVLEPKADKHAARRVLWRVLPSKARGPRAGKEQLGNAKMWVDESGVLKAESDNLGLSLQIRAPDEQSRFEFAEPYALTHSCHRQPTTCRTQSQA